MRLALDAMGGDDAPASAVRGGVLFAKEQPQHEVILVGDEGRLGPLLRESRAPANVKVRHASEAVSMDDSAASVMRQKRDSSMRVAFDLLKAREVEAMVSAGHSGAMMAGALLVLGRLAEVERPAIAALLPGPAGSPGWLLLDAGANVQCKPSQLVQFAVMGEAFFRARFGVGRPRVAVLSNGEEDSKGTELTRETLQLLRRSDLEVTGYVEGKDLFAGQADVVVTDGFTGNVVLKTSEGTAGAVLRRIRGEVGQLPAWRKIGARLLRPAFRRLSQMADYAEVGGAPLLGVDGVTIIAHGRSSPKAFKNALRAGLQLAEGKLLENVSSRLAVARSWTVDAPSGDTATR